MKMSALALKEEGNKYFAARLYNEAISCYSKAINKDSHIPQFYTNRALCHLKLQKWEKACEDCKRALEMDHTLVKGHFFRGQALVELGQLDEAVATLKTAYDYAREQRLNVGEDVATALRTAKKKRWHLIEEKRMKEEIELQTFLSTLVKKHYQNEKDSVDLEKRISQINDLFRQIDERRQRREVPDTLTCRISFEIMDDPVITPSGITYNRRDLEEHLQRVGHFDPVTRASLTQSNLIPNLALKEVIEEFVANNDWVDDY